MEATRTEDMTWLVGQLQMRHPKHTFNSTVQHIIVDQSPPFFVYYQEFYDEANGVTFANEHERCMSRRMSILLFVERIFNLKHDYSGTPNDE